MAKAYALQAGREIRVIVEPTEVDDDAAALLSHEIAREIEDQLEYPGQVKVIVIRETRSIEIAAKRGHELPATTSSRRRLTTRTVQRLLGAELGESQVSFVAEATSNAPRPGSTPAPVPRPSGKPLLRGERAHRCTTSRPVTVETPRPGRGVARAEAPSR